LPLPPPAPRDELHLRRIEIRGYHRKDGLYDIEARITDTKNNDLELSEKSVPAGMPIHDMWLRLTVDEKLTVHDAIAATDASPFTICPQAAGAITALKGLRSGPGWTRSTKERRARADNCTHLVELLGQIATTAFQTLAPLRNSRPDRVDAKGLPFKMNSCFAYASKREVALKRWPQFYDGPTK